LFDQLRGENQKKIKKMKKIQKKRTIKKSGHFAIKKIALPWLHFLSPYVAGKKAFQKDSAPRTGTTPH